MATDTIAKNALHARRAGSTSAVWGYVIVLAAAVSFLLAMYVMFFAQLPSLFLDDTTDGLLRAVERDTYYCYLVPLTIPVAILAFYANWVSLKFFRHN